MAGVYEVIDPPHRLVHSWCWTGGPPEARPDRQATRVTFDIAPDGDGSRLAFTHEHLADTPSAESHRTGRGEALNTLATWLDRGKNG